MNCRCSLVWARAGAASLVLALALPSTVWAGPVELFTSIEVASGNPDRVVARWINGDGGILFSDDRAASFKMSCYSAVSGALMGRSVQAAKATSDGGMCVGTIDQLFCSDVNGCGWKEATEMKGQWISDFAEDPIDKNKIYAVTGTAEGDNGVYVRESPTSMWKPLGTQLPAWFSRVFVTKNGAGRRIYVSSQENVMVPGMDGGAPTQAPKYFIRYSDDDAKTWTSLPYGDVPDRTNLRLVGVDPTNPDRILVLLVRSAEELTDDLFYNDKRGEAGSYVKVGTVTAWSGATFLPDGTLWYGDNDQDTPGLYKVAKLGEAPVKVSGSYKVGCIDYDPASERLYVCADWRMGTADQTTGVLTTLFDIRQSAGFIDCPGEVPLDKQCAPALMSPNFCDVSHYPEAPVCVTYFGTSAAGSSAAGGGGSSAGTAAGAGGMSVTAASSGTGGSGGESGGAAGSAGSAGSSGAGAKHKDSGCSVRAAGSQSGSPWLGLGLAFAVVSWRRKRRPAARSGV